MTPPRLLLIAALAAGGCADTTDERPATFEYLVTAVLAPSCGTATCHSTMTEAEGYAFDTVESARATFVRQPLDGCFPPDPCDPALSRLYRVVTTDGSESSLPRMPIDSPLPDADVALIERWILDGAVRP